MAWEKIRMNTAWAAFAGALLLAGCSQDSAPTPVVKTTPSAKSAPAPVKKGPTAEELTTGMVQAAGLGKSPMPVEVKFDLGSRPKLGQPLEINLALIPQASGGPATVAVSATDGFDAVDGGKFDVPDVESGEVYRHTIHLTPKAEGVLIVAFNVSLKHDDVTDAKDFNIPVIVASAP
jgi:hypothetical protein